MSQWDFKRAALADRNINDWWNNTTDIVMNALNNGIETHNIFGSHYSGTFNDSRTRMHDDILADFAAIYDSVPRDKKAIITGGAPGSGKTGFIYSEGYPEEYAIVDADIFKSILISKGQVPDVEGLTPLEHGSLCHFESVWLAKRLFLNLSEQGTNLLWDFTMSNIDSVQSRTHVLEQRGYHRKSVFIDVNVEVSESRVRARHREGVEAFLRGEGMGGRYVPTHTINLKYPLKCFKKTKPCFHEWAHYDNNGEKIKVVDRG